MFFFSTRLMTIVRRTTCAHVQFMYALLFFFRLDICARGKPMRRDNRVEPEHVRGTIGELCRIKGFVGYVIANAQNSFKNVPEEERISVEGAFLACPATVGSIRFFQQVLSNIPLQGLPASGGIASLIPGDTVLSIDQPATAPTRNETQVVTTHRVATRFRINANVVEDGKTVSRGMIATSACAFPSFSGEVALQYAKRIAACPDYNGVMQPSPLVFGAKCSSRQMIAPRAEPATQGPYAANTRRGVVGETLQIVGGDNIDSAVPYAIQPHYLGNSTNRLYWYPEITSGTVWVYAAPSAQTWTMYAAVAYANTSQSKSVVSRVPFGRRTPISIVASLGYSFAGVYVWITNTTDTVTVPGCVVDWPQNAMMTNAQVVQLIGVPVGQEINVEWAAVDYVNLPPSKAQAQRVTITQAHQPVMLLRRPQVFSAGKRARDEDEVAVPCQLVDVDDRSIDNAYVAPLVRTFGMASESTNAA